MTSKITFVDPAVAAYIAEHTEAPTELEQRLIDETAAMANAGMQIGFPQGAFMALLTRLLQPATVVEIGVFTGYSALKVAQELRDDATLIACDLSAEWTSIAKPYWHEAGVADRIDLRIGPASETLAALPPELIVDMAFIDADKTGYRDYLEHLVPHLRPGSVVLVDNVLWGGSIIDESDQSPDTIALREFNDAVLADPRLDVALLPIGDGLSMITLKTTALK